MSDSKIEKIGNVTLDLTYYPGEDFYSEGEAEDALLDLVKKHPQSDYDKLIQQHCSWSIMYHLSHVRENVISWLPLYPGSKVLEVGAGCGAITGELARRAESVTCIELSKKRSTINATRHMDCDNLTIMVGNFETIEPTLTEKYDVITLIGVLEYATSYMTGEHKHHAMINALKKHLAPGGRIVIAIENRLGLKYFAGCKEDHTGKYFGGIQGYRVEDGVRTFTRPQLEMLLNQCGLKTKFYYPYPDYKLPHTIYSEEKLPEMGELNTNIRNFDNDRLVLFDEERAFDAIIFEGVFPTYANSFIVVATEGTSYDEWDEVPIFAKYSDERMERLRMSTRIMRYRDGSKAVYKEALTTKANEHVKKIYNNYETMLTSPDYRKMIPNRCEYIPGVEPHPLLAGVASKARDSVKLEFLSGITLENYFEELENRSEYGKIERILKMYTDLLENVDTIDFTPTSEFERIFGKRTFKKSYKSVKTTDFDMIFSNIVLDRNELEYGKWNVLDYEWMFDFPVPITFIIYRSLFYQFGRKEDSGFNNYLKAKGTDVYSLCHIDLGERMLFDEMERSFQRYIIDGVASLEVMQVMMPTTTIGLNRVVEQGSYLRGLNTPKIYYSRGMVFTPDQRLNIIAKVTNSLVSLRIPFEHYLTSIRVDPTEYPCMLYIDSIRAVKQDGSRPEVASVLVNGYQIRDRMILYNTDDAQIIVENVPPDTTALEVTYIVTMYEQVFFNETLKLCMDEEARKKERDSKFIHRAMRKLHLEKRPDTPEGYVRISLEKQ